MKPLKQIGLLIGGCVLAAAMCAGQSDMPVFPALPFVCNLSVSGNPSGQADNGLQKDSSEKQLTYFSVTTLAGCCQKGFHNGQGKAASFSQPADVAVDITGNVYVADAANNLIRKITPDGVVSTFAGSGVAGKSDGRDVRASFHYPSGIATDAAGNVYVADKGNHCIRKILPDGTVVTLAGSGVRGNVNGNGKKACFDKPVSVVADTSGNVYVADQCNHAIRKITPDGHVSTLAGSGKPGSRDGRGSEASFFNPSDVTVDAAGNIYVADYGNNRIRKITPDGNVTTLTGSNTTGRADGTASKASFFFPDAVAVDIAGNVYIADQVNHLIRKLTPEGMVSTIAGSGSAGYADNRGGIALFNYPAGIAVDLAGNIYVADQFNNSIRKIQVSYDAKNIQEGILNPEKAAVTQEALMPKQIAQK